MAEPVRARRLTDQEGQRLQQIVRGGRRESIRVRRAVILRRSSFGHRTARRHDAARPDKRSELQLACE
jgi:hypothetical protein